MSAPLDILHVLRAPVGGLFRHVADLVRAQNAAGHRVGIICCTEASDRLTESRLAALQADLALGLLRIPMAREIGPKDFSATRTTRAHALKLGVDVLHGHGAKGGAYARLAASGLKQRGAGTVSLYTPHGGSLHYAPGSLKGRVFMAMERHLAGKTDGIIFESAYSARIYARNVAPAHSMATRIIPNGVGPDEFTPVATADNNNDVNGNGNDDDVADFVFVGELRKLKGVDLLLNALASIREPKAPSAVIVGDGPDAAAFKAQADALGLTSRVRFPGAMPAAQAFRLGRSLVMPSRAESFPYVVLEAGAARLPMIATSVGGIPEIVQGSTTPLVPPEDWPALAMAMHRHLVDRELVTQEARSLQDIIKKRFTTARMSAQVLAFYDDLRHR